MLTISSTEINKELTEIWPSLFEVWCFDPVYPLLSYEYIESRLHGGWWFDVNEIKADDPDPCNHLALQQHAFVRLNEFLPFGQAFGDRFNGWSGAHMNNIFVCIDGVYIVNPGKREIIKANSKKDNVLWVRF
jgi:hypothetical protein